MTGSALPPRRLRPRPVRSSSRRAGRKNWPGRAACSEKPSSATASGEVMTTPGRPRSESAGGGAARGRRAAGRTLRPPPAESRELARWAVDAHATPWTARPPGPRAAGRRCRSSRRLQPRLMRLRPILDPMRKVVLGLGISLDGYIARRDGAVDFLVMPRDYSMAPFLATIDTALMGRKTYEVALAMGGGSFGGASMTSYVFARSRPPGQRDGVIFTNRSPAAVMRQLRTRAGKHIWLMGGGELARAFLRADLVDELYLGIVPVLLGSGIPLFPSGFPQRDFALLENKELLERLDLRQIPPVAPPRPLRGDARRSPAQARARRWPRGRDLEKRSRRHDEEETAHSHRLGSVVRAKSCHKAYRPRRIASGRACPPDRSAPDFVQGAAGHRLDVYSPDSPRGIRLDDVKAISYDHGRRVVPRAMGRLRGHRKARRGR